MSRFAAIIVLIFGLVEAQAQEAPKCQPVRAEGAAYLEKCGSRLRSFVLSMEGTKRASTRTARGMFQFTCSPGVCTDEPDITGWFIDPSSWRQSQRDEAEIFNLLSAAAGWKMLGSEQAFRTMFKPDCPVSETQIAGLEARMICYTMTGSTAEGLAVYIVVVAGDPEFAFVVTFVKPGVNLADLRTQAFAAIQSFQLQRATGDATLERWIK